MSTLVPINVEEVARARYTALQPLETESLCPNLDRTVRLLAGELKSMEARTHIRTCPCCRLAEQEMAEPSPGVVRWAAPIALAASVLLVSTLWVTQRQSPITLPAEPDTGLSPKGAAPVAEVDRFRVAVRRGEQEWVLQDGDILQAGDVVGFFAQTRRDGHLLVLHVDSQLEVTALHPAAGGNSAALQAGPEAALPNSARLSASAPGCQWFVAVFSDAPLSAQSLQTTLEANGCELTVTAPEAHSALVKSVRR
jgi:hypothetical protein